METIWTAHRFSGDALALNVANTVVLRNDPARTFDRFDDPDEIVRFAVAAGRFCAEEVGGRALKVIEPAEARLRVIALREAADAFFRNHASDAETRPDLLAPLIGLCAEALAAGPVALADDRIGAEAGADPIDLEAAVALSALALLEPAKRRRIRICANCSWLFIDKSKNGSRLWCDMSVCGNRRKAKRHYEKKRGATGEKGDV
jgi:predicted RNA-binding Zn ribbon-like protein